MSRNIAELALEQYADEISKYPGVQGVGVEAESGSLVVYVANRESAQGLPAAVHVVDTLGNDITVPVLERVIGQISPE